jgi:hypothetical protein
LAAIIVKGIPDDLRDTFKAWCSARGITLREGIIELMINEVKDKTLNGLMRRYKVSRHGRNSELLDSEVIEAKNAAKALKQYIRKHPDNEPEEPTDGKAISEDVADVWEMGNYRHFKVNNRSYVVIPD